MNPIDFLESWLFVRESLIKTKSEVSVCSGELHRFWIYFMIPI
jgi:hypothetical protein